MAILRRLSGAVLVLVASASILFSLFLIFQVWSLKVPVTTRITNGIELISNTLQTTSEGLVIANQSLNAANTSFTALESTVETLAKSIDDTTPMIDSMETMMGENLPETIEATQTSLDSAQESAAIIDSVLRGITAIPFFPGEPYNPPVPLHLALAQISTNLDGLPASFATIETSLGDTRGNMLVVKAEINLIARQLDQINASLQDSQEVLENYQMAVTEIQESINTLLLTLPAWMTVGAWILTFIFLWLGIAQWGLFVQGLHLMRRQPPAEEE